MAKRKDIEHNSSETAGPASAPLPLSDINCALPAVESPSISPAVEAPAIEPDTHKSALEHNATLTSASVPESEVGAASPPARARFRLTLNSRHKNKTLLAASVALAAAIGTAIGAVATGGFAPPPSADVAGLHERQAMQQSITRLSEEITTLKTSIAAANRAAHSQIAKITDKVTERLDQPKTPETTGSIPTPAPRPGIAALESWPPARPPVIGDWSIRDARDGYVYVQGHGDIYQVVPGARLPGLGAVQSITRQGGRWVVLTPKGLIVSTRDRRFFE
jgi:hypothetical protein